MCEYSILEKKINEFWGFRFDYPRISRTLQSRSSHRHCGRKLGSSSHSVRAPSLPWIPSCTRPSASPLDQGSHLGSRQTLWTLPPPLPSSPSLPRLSISRRPHKLLESCRRCSGVLISPSPSPLPLGWGNRRFLHHDRSSCRSSLLGLSTRAEILISQLDAEIEEKTRTLIEIAAGSFLVRRSSGGRRSRARQRKPRNWCCCAMTNSVPPFLSWKGSVSSAEWMFRRRGCAKINWRRMKRGCLKARTTVGCISRSSMAVWHRNDLGRSGSDFSGGSGSRGKTSINNLWFVLWEQHGNVKWSTFWTPFFRRRWKLPRCCLSFPLSGVPRLVVSVSGQNNLPKLTRNFSIKRQFSTTIVE